MNYWLGPHGMRVPSYINCVVAEDGYNTMSKGGFSTQVYCNAIEPTKSEYLAKYAELRADGFYYYKISKSTGCPTCKMEADYYNYCDNDCDTVICKKCREEYYVTNGVSAKGHDPQCGE
jgi:hypothetical protein